MHCLQCFRNEKALNNYKENFITINGAHAIKLPKARDMVYFKNYQKGLAAPFVTVMLILRLLRKKYMAVNQIMINHILNHIKAQRL